MSVRNNTQSGSARRIPRADEKFEKSLTSTSFILFSFFVLLYLAGSLYPDSFLWGVHQLAFFDVGARLALFTLSMVLALPWISALYVSRLESMMAPERPRKAIVLPVLLVVGALGALGFFWFRISTDMYGDSRTLLVLLSQRTFAIADLFKAGVIDDSLREPLTRLIHQWAARLFHADQRLVFQWVSSACGGLFLMFFPYAVLTLKGSPVWKAFLLVTGLSCGANQLFFGHVEDYTLAYFAILFLLVFSWKLFDGHRMLPLVVAIFLVGTRLHLAMVLFTPALLYLVLHSNSQKHPRLKSWIKPRNITVAVVLSLVAGTYLYFFYFKADHFVVGDQAERELRVFLPLVNPYTAPHSYTLLSLSHFSDIIQEFLLTVPPGAVILLALVAGFARHIQWKSPRTIFFGLAAFYFMLFDVTVNPLLSPERDWDLLSLAAAPVMFFAVALSKDWFEQFRDSWFPRAAVGIALALAVLSCSLFYVDSNPPMTGHRLRALGMWVYNSYYLGSAYLLNMGPKYLPSRPAEIDERINTLRELEASKSNPDLELGFLSHKVADLLYLDGRYPEARQYYLKSLHEDPYNASAVKALAAVSLYTGDVDAAVDYMRYYNDHINAQDIVDADGLLIAEKMNHLQYLLFTKADSAQIAGTVEDMHLDPRE